MEAVRDASFLSWTESRAAFGQMKRWRRLFQVKEEHVGRPRGERACGPPETGKKMVWRGGSRPHRATKTMTRA